MTNLYTIANKQTWASAIALAVFAIGSAAAADSTFNDIGTASREAPIGAIHTSSADQRASFIELSSQAAIVSPTSAVKQTRNWDTTERSTLTVSNREKDHRRLEDQANYALVVNASGNGNYGDVFEQTDSLAKVSWVVAKKCGWLCVRVEF